MRAESNVSRSLDGGVGDEHGRLRLGQREGRAQRQEGEGQKDGSFAHDIGLLYLRQFAGTVGGYQKPAPPLMNASRPPTATSTHTRRPEPRAPRTETSASASDRVLRGWRRIHRCHPLTLTSPSAKRENP